MKLTEINGEPQGAGARVAIVAARFNATVTDALVAGAVGVLRAAGIEECLVVRVPGALELGLTLRRLADSGYDGLIAIGAVIEGETDHYEHVATQASAAITRVALDTGVPVGNAVLTVREVGHARDRSLPGPGNKGAEAAQATLEMIDLLGRV